MPGGARPGLGQVGLPSVSHRLSRHAARRTPLPDQRPQEREWAYPGGKDATEGAGGRGMASQPQGLQVVHTVFPDANSSCVLDPRYRPPVRGRRRSPGTAPRQCLRVRLAGALDRTAPDSVIRTAFPRPVNWCRRTRIEPRPNACRTNAATGHGSPLAKRRASND